MKKFFNFLNSLPRRFLDMSNWIVQNPKKAFVRFIYVLISLVATVLLWRQFSSYIKKEINTFGSSISDDEAKKKAGFLFTAMDGFGTYTSDIIDILNNVDSKGFKKIEYYFGERAYLVAVGGEVVWPLGESLGLMGWLNHELTDSEKENIEGLYPYISFS